MFTQANSTAQEIRVMWAVTISGWILVATLMSCYVSTAIWVAAPWLIPTLFLTLKKDFPNRKQGLIFSWVGPAIIMITDITTLSIEKAMTMRLELDLEFPSSLWVLAFVAVLDAGTILIMAWLSRGYGAIPLLAMFSMLAHRRYGIENAARNYPWHRWWLVPLFAMTAAALKLVVLGWWLSNA